MKVKEYIQWLLPSRKWRVLAIIITGVIVGGGALFLYMLGHILIWLMILRPVSTVTSWDLIMQPGSIVRIAGMLRAMTVMFPTKIL